MKLLEGVYSALFSVYDENLNVKKDTVEKMINYQLENGIKGFYVGGATGECVVWILLLIITTKKMVALNLFLQGESNYGVLYGIYTTL